MSKKDSKALSKKQFEDIYLSNYRSLFSFGFRLCGDREFTKDLIQALFLELWEKRNQLNDIQYWNAYLKKSLHRKMMRELKNQSKTSKEISDENNLSPTPSYEELLINFQKEEAKRRELKIAIEQLPIEQRKVLQMRFYEGWTYEEIAENTGKSKQTIYNQIFSAIKKLKKIL